MILSEIKRYLALHRRVPIADLVNRFEVEPDALRGMLDIWIDKGKVRRTAIEGTCGGCSKCAAFAMEVYEWTG